MLTFRLDYFFLIHIESNSCNVSLLNHFFAQRVELKNCLPYKNFYLSIAGCNAILDDVYAVYIDDLIDGVSACSINQFLFAGVGRECAYWHSLVEGKGMHNKTVPLLEVNCCSCLLHNQYYNISIKVRAVILIETAKQATIAFLHLL